ncbi:MAG: HPr family phosphocarrier protein [Gammaproteobacteria bacterium]|jgi:phosphocarrier protein HPr|nr:HPr family phosphocarrier protein [Gammaproteobacteria bacterium]
MQKVKVEITNKAGLHARAAFKLVELAATFSSDIRVGHEKMVDGKSILSLMMLAAVKGTELSIEIDGADEDVAVTAIVALISNRFGEDEQSTTSTKL